MNKQVYPSRRTGVTSLLTLVLMVVMAFLSRWIPDAIAGIAILLLVQVVLVRNWGSSIPSDSWLASLTLPGIAITGAYTIVTLVQSFGLISLRELTGFGIMMIILLFFTSLVGYYKLIPAVWGRTASCTVILTYLVGIVTSYVHQQYLILEIAVGIGISIVVAILTRKQKGGFLGLWITHLGGCFSVAIFLTLIQSEQIPLVMSYLFVLTFFSASVVHLFRRWRSTEK